MVIKAMASFKAFTFADLTKQNNSFPKMGISANMYHENKNSFVQKMVQLAFSLKTEF